MPDQSRRPGRPRSVESHRAIVRAATEIVLESGYRALTIEAIARRSGVGKQTIYRWWPHKAAILVEAITERAAEEVALPDEGLLADRLTLLLGQTVRALAGSAGPVLAALMAEAQLDDEFGESFRTGFLAARRRVLHDLLEQARQRGEVAEGADLDLAVDLTFGTLWYRLLARHAPLDDDLVERLVRGLLAAL